MTKKRTSLALLAALALVTAACGDSGSSTKQDTGTGGGADGGRLDTGAVLDTGGTADTGGGTADTGGGTADTGGGTGDSGGGTADSGSTSPKVTTIQKIRDETIKDGETVTLKGVIVLAADDYPGNLKQTGNVWIGDPAGGANSGLLIFQPKLAGGGDAWKTLKPGDTVDVTGKLVHWNANGNDITTDFCPNKKYIYELLRPTVTVTKKGNGTYAAKIKTTSRDLALAATCADVEKNEHQLITVENVWVTAPDDKEAFTGDAVTQIAGWMYVHPAKVGECLSITGVWYYWKGWRVLPRSKDDIKVSTGCTVDSLKISDIQDTASAKHPKEITRVKVSGVVTAVDSTKDSLNEYDGFFVQDPAGGKHSGIFVFHIWTDQTPTAERPKLGENVEVTGTYVEIDGNTELWGASWVNKGAGTIPAPLVVSAADIGAGGAKAEPYEGVLVQVNNVEVGKYQEFGGTKYGFYDKTTNAGFDNWFYDIVATPPAIGTKYTKIIGPLIDFGLEFFVLPRSAADLVK